MAMTEALASTGAQTIPVFALAGVLEARAVISTSQARSATNDAVRRRPAQIIGRIVAIIALYTLGLCNLVAELYCLEVLSGDLPDPEAQAFVYLAIMGSLVFLVIFPLYTSMNAAGRLPETLSKPEEESRD
ncbi:hypothetical protein Airi01_091250 [Actinoallomurus iriomotensis]|uniref:Uncharacterized protein n=1 Tax=Actinoallomurus iriomotensis TaxID=478107 RepID=A0A9W6VQ96_9ACTN|nr:hypothetical protein Airi01_091250 [Actinoallomurus iriomotensis]